MIMAGLIFAAVLAVIIILSFYILLRKRKLAKETRIISPNGIDCREFVTIGGIAQYLHHRGENVDNPVLLFLHGGPGEPILPFAYRFQLAWEQRVTVVHWDQRGCGKTYFRNETKRVAPTVTVERLVEDTYEVVQHLKQKYNKDQIIIMGHSWGSVLGSLFARKYPGEVQAYIGVGQVVNMMDNERLGYEKVTELAKEAGSSDYEKLLQLEPYPLPAYSKMMISKLAAVRKYQRKYKLAAGPTMALVRDAFCSPFYSIKDMGYFIISGAFADGQRHIWDYLLQTFDLPALGTKYEMPVFHIHGENDWQTPYPLVKTFFTTIEAPMKHFYSIPNAGHAVMLDQTERFNEALFHILEV
ncbi:alpha/beta fold hydrolase [Paenibacillus sp. GCM10027626]|uniref:alpha/beta fold hydrolase n=1 Tax=Paenibacillus sp. GCM10027626 TaxID=3273411 RepID=UPI00362D08C0